jgi:uncharacterized protein HemY
LVLEKGMEDEFIEEDAAYWEMLANSWLLAREFDRALAPLQTGAEISEKGDLYARLGQLHLEREQWADAAKALKSAIDKGDLRDEATTHLLLAISYYHQKQYQNSTRHLKTARLSETEAIRNSANQWLILVGRDAEALREAQAEAAQFEEAPQGETAPQPEQAAQPEEAPQDETAPQPEQAAQPEEAPQDETAPQPEQAAQPEEAPPADQVSQVQLEP